MFMNLDFCRVTSYQCSRFSKHMISFLFFFFFNSLNKCAYYIRHLAWGVFLGGAFFWDGGKIRR